jgi:hypothetical protein
VSKQRRSGHASGMAGEFFVMEKLFRLGHEPALTLGNAKSVDVLVRTKTGRTMEISVKAIRRGAGKWGVDVDDVSTRKDLIYVFLHYAAFDDATTTPEVYVIPAKSVQKMKEPWFKKSAIYCSNQACRERLLPYKDRWELIG